MRNRMDKRDANGRFVKGAVANPNGNNQFTSIVPIIEALKAVGKEKREDFWIMVAKKAWVSDTVLVHILKKLLPDRKEIEYEFNQATQEDQRLTREEIKKMSTAELVAYMNRNLLGR